MNNNAHAWIIIFKQVLYTTTEVIAAISEILQIIMILLNLNDKYGKLHLPMLIRNNLPKKLTQNGHQRVMKVAFHSKENERFSRSIQNISHHSFDTAEHGSPRSVT